MVIALPLGSIIGCCSAKFSLIGCCSVKQLEYEYSNCFKVLIVGFCDFFGKN